MEKFDRLFNIEESIDLRGKCDQVFTLRMPKGLVAILDKHIKHIKLKTGILMTRNDYINFIVLDELNLNESTNGFYQLQNEATMTKYIDEHAEELKERLMKRMFEKRYNQVTHKK